MPLCHRWLVGKGEWITTITILLSDLHFWQSLCTLAEWSVSKDCITPAAISHNMWPVKLFVAELQEPRTFTWWSGSTGFFGHAWQSVTLSLLSRMWTQMHFRCLFPPSVQLDQCRFLCGRLPNCVWGRPGESQPSPAAGPHVVWGHPLCCGGVHHPGSHSRKFTGKLGRVYRETRLKSLNSASRNSQTMLPHP